MKFKLDENIPTSAVEILRSAGLETSTVSEQGLSGIEDPQLFDIIQDEERVLVTLDLGFSDIRAYPPIEHNGIIVLRPKSQDIHNILSFIQRITVLCTSEKLHHRLWIIDNNRLRIRE